MSNKTGSNPRRHDLMISRGGKNQGPGQPDTPRTDKTGPKSRHEPTQADRGSSRVERYENAKVERLTTTGPAAARHAPGR